MIYLNGTTNIYGMVTIGSGSAFVPPDGPSSTLLIDLESYYKLDETSGTTVSSEMNGYTGTTGGTMATNGIGLINKGLHTDTESEAGIALSMVNSTNWDIDSGTPKTINVWLKVNQSSSHWVFGRGTNRPVWYWQTSNTGTMLFTATHTSASFRLTINANYTIQSGVWRMFTLTSTGVAPMTSSTIKLFLDGVEIIPTSETGALTLSCATTEVFYVGDYGAGGNNVNSIDEFGNWNRVLTQSEITELYNSGNGNQYPF